MKGVKGFQAGHETSLLTRQKIGLANKGIWVKYICDYCGRENEEKISHYKKSKRHFCNKGCYSNFRREKLNFTEQPNYRGVRKEGESKQIYHRRYCNGHPNIIAHLKSMRYAKEKGAIGSHTLQEWNLLKESYGNVCAVCKLPKPLTKDHIIPLSKGGSNYIENIQPLCRNCNSKKHTKINPELLNS